jgi:hypothetical protein
MKDWFTGRMVCQNTVDASDPRAEVHSDVRPVEVAAMAGDDPVQAESVVLPTFAVCDVPVSPQHVADEAVRELENSIVSRW